MSVIDPAWKAVLEKAEEMLKHRTEAGILLAQLAWDPRLDGPRNYFAEFGNLAIGVWPVDGDWRILVGHQAIVEIDAKIGDDDGQR